MYSEITFREMVLSNLNGNDCCPHGGLVYAEIEGTPKMHVVNTDHIGAFCGVVNLIKKSPTPVLYACFIMPPSMDVPVEFCFLIRWDKRAEGFDLELYPFCGIVFEPVRKGKMFDTLAKMFSSIFKVEGT